MPKFFINQSDIHEHHVCIVGENVNHIKNVLRLKTGENIIVSNGNGMDFLVRLDTFEPTRITAAIIQSVINQTEPPIAVTLLQGIPKSEKMEFIIQKCVELGVKRIVPVFTERTVVKIVGSKDALKKVERWKKIISEAAKQCNRGMIPEITPPMSFEHALMIAQESELGIIPYEKETTNGIGRFLKKGIQSVSVMIGPEGGFSEEEVRKAEEKGIHSVSLGPRILRTETAGLAVMSILMYELGDMGI